MANHLQSKTNPATEELSHPNNLSLPPRSVSDIVLNDFTNCCMTPTTTVNNPKRGIDMGSENSEFRRSIMGLGLRK
ncbi:unnamed protein product [Brassica oleracea var. botrytis]